MKINTTTKLALSVTSVSVLIAVNFQSAYAQQRGGARFNFAPNVYPLEHSNVPPCNYDQSSSSVRSGHVPSGKDILGLDPGSLPPAPSVVASAPVVHVPNLMQATPAHYQESFGAPNNVSPLEATSKALGPHALPKTQDKQYTANRAVSGKLLHAKNNHLYANKNVAGKLLKKNHSAGQSGQALALAPAASYGKNFGYEPGSYVPHTYGNGTNVSKDVFGKLLHRN